MAYLDVRLPPTVLSLFPTTSNTARMAPLLRRFPLSLAAAYAWTFVPLFCLSQVRISSPKSSTPGPRDGLSEFPDGPMRLNKESRKRSEAIRSFGVPLVGSCWPRRLAVICSAVFRMTKRANPLASTQQLIQERMCLP